MIDRISSGFHPFVIPFLVGMAFVLLYCVYGIIRILVQLPSYDRKRFLISLIMPKTILKNIKEIFADCLFHVKLWKRNRMLGFMHSSIAFGWFMLIILGHLEVMLFVPERIHLFYYPIFFNFFVAESDTILAGSLLFFLMDLFLLVVLSGILLAIVKRLHSRIFGMRGTTRHSLVNMIGMYALWAIFPLRFLAESFTAHISGGSFLTVPAGWVLRCVFGENPDMMPFWWAYSIALCVFMFVLPFSRYMHIPAEMMLIPMRNAGLKIRDVNRGFARVQVLSCPNCGICIDACPMSINRTDTKDCTVYLTRQIRRRNEKRMDEISDKCLLCGKCQALCQVGVEGPQLRIMQRSKRRYSIEGNYAGLASTQMIDGDKDTSILYFSGCMSQLTPEIGRSVESILKKAGDSYIWLDRDGGLCCGRPLYTAGRFEEATCLVKQNESIILASKAKILLVSCPICYRMFTEMYDLPGIRILHHSQYFDELLASDRVEFEKSDICYVYHDPCELGRGCGIYDEPRRVIGQVASISEAQKTREESICCGGSLGSLSLDFAKRERITTSALKNLYTSNADAIATACPLCKSTFNRLSDRPVRDLAEIFDAQTRIINTSDI